MLKLEENLGLSTSSKVPKNCQKTLISEILIRDKSRIAGMGTRKICRKMSAIFIAKSSGS